MWWKNYSIWLKTERETIISNCSDFIKIAPTVPLCNVWDQNRRISQSPLCLFSPSICVYIDLVDFKGHKLGLPTGLCVRVTSRWTFGGIGTFGSGACGDLKEGLWDILQCEYVTLWVLVGLLTTMIIHLSAVFRIYHTEDHKIYR